MSSAWIRTGKEKTFTSHGYDNPSQALKNLESDIKVRRIGGEQWTKVTKYKYIRDDGLVMEVIFK